MELLIARLYENIESGIRFFNEKSGWTQVEQLKVRMDSKFRVFSNMCSQSHARSTCSFHVCAEFRTGSCPVFFVRAPLNVCMQRLNTRAPSRANRASARA